MLVACPKIEVASELQTWNGRRVTGWHVWLSTPPLPPHPNIYIRTVLSHRPREDTAPSQGVALLLWLAERWGSSGSILETSTEWRQFQFQTGPVNRVAQGQQSNWKRGRNRISSSHWGCPGDKCYEPQTQRLWRSGPKGRRLGETEPRLSLGTSWCWERGSPGSFPPFLVLQYPKAEMFFSSRV